MKMRQERRSYLIIDAGGTFLKTAILLEDGTTCETSQFSTFSYSDEPAEKIFFAFKEAIDYGFNFIRRNQLEICGIGIAIPGPFDFRKNIPFMQHKYQSIYGINLGEKIRELAGTDHQIPVVFMHDANAVLAGEQWKGNAQGYQNSAVVTLGTGLGFTHSQNRIIQCNETGSPLVSIFGTPYRQGILEDYVSKRGLLKIYAELSGRDILNGMRVADIGFLADKGDSTGIRTFQKAGEILAETLHDILTEKNIECLLFAGQISRSFRHMEDSLRKGLKDIPYLKKIAPVQSIDHAAFRGILRFIIENGEWRVENDRENKVEQG